MSRLIVTFHSHFCAISFQRAAAKLGIEAKLRPVPRQLSSSCGTCVALPINSLQEKEIFQYDGVEAIYELPGI